LKIRFHYDIEGFRVSENRIIKKIAEKIVSDAGLKGGIIDIIFTSDIKLLEINKEFLSHDYYTDIITFDYSERKIIAGEIYISIERVKENAANLNISKKEECKRVIFHGFLHLCGYKDNTDADKYEMRRMEDMYLDLSKAE